MQPRQKVFAILLLFLVTSLAILKANMNIVIKTVAILVLGYVGFISGALIILKYIPPGQTLF
jgi:hypothetical protein